MEDPALDYSDRVALVVGNADYEGIGADLRNPINDAQDISATLRRLGFTVVLGTDLGRDQMEEAVRTFARRARKAEVALVFYAGHGIELDGENYLIPVDARIENKSDLRRYGVEASWVVDNAREGASLGVLILDACRNNPFSLGDRSAFNRGLRRMETPRGAVIAYAAAPGEVASDGSGENGLFTSALLAEIEKPGVEFVTMLRRVRERVHDASKGTQWPTVDDMSMGLFVLAAEPQALDQTPPSPTGQRDTSPLEGGRARMLAADPTGALPLLQETVRQNPSSLEGWYLLGQAYTQLRRYDDAVDVLDRARKMAPEGNSGPVFQAYLNALVVSSQTNRALTELQAAIASDPDNHLLRYNYGTLLLGQESYSHAMEQLLVATTLDPSDADAHYNLGVTYLREAARVETEAGAVPLSDVDGYNRLISRRDQMINLAVGAFEAARRYATSTTEPVVCTALAKVYAAAGRSDKLSEAVECSSRNG